MEIVRVRNKFDLACQYPGQLQPQPCYVCLDLRHGTLSAKYLTEIGEILPETTHHGKVRLYRIPCLLARSANDLLEMLAPYAERVIAGYSSIWNGSNHVALLNGSALAAVMDIKAICANCFYSDWMDDRIQFCSAEDWLQEQNVKGTLSRVSDAGLEKMAMEIAAEAEDCNIYLTGRDVLEILTEWKNEETGVKE